MRQPHNCQHAKEHSAITSCAAEQLRPVSAELPRCKQQMVQESAGSV
jgi:hypothetical protein